MEYPKESSWKRERPEDSLPQGVAIKVKTNHISETFHRKAKANREMNMETKRAALKASPSVVSLACLKDDRHSQTQTERRKRERERRGKKEREKGPSRPSPTFSAFADTTRASGRTDGKLIFLATGTIIDCSKEINGTYSSTILTSASLIPYSTDDIKIEVSLSNGRVFDGRIFAYDRHYNLAIVNIGSDAPLPIATLRLLDDSISIDSREIFPPGDNFQILPHSNRFKFCPGVKLVAIGRHRHDSLLLVAPGKFSIDCCEFDCKELMRASCIISMCGIGGPLVNFFGEVIGVNFYHERCTPFLPINIVSKWLEHFKKHGRFYRPSLGMEVANLYTADASVLETILQNFPHIFKAVIVEKVIPGSRADCAGILEDDVIVQCGENFVMGFLEFFEQIWDKAGESFELAVIRKGSDAFLKLTMVADDTSLDQSNSWPIPKERYVALNY